MSSHSKWFTTDYFSATNKILRRVLKQHGYENTAYLLETYGSLDGYHKQLYRLFCANKNVKALALQHHKQPKQWFEGFLHRYSLKQKSTWFCISKDIFVCLLFLSFCWWRFCFFNILCDFFKCYKFSQVSFQQRPKYSHMKTLSEHCTTLVFTSIPCNPTNSFEDTRRNIYENA